MSPTSSLVTAELKAVTVAGLVPAAGASRRMGTDKRILPYQGHTVLEVTIDSLRQGGVGPIVVVLEPESKCKDLQGLSDVIVAINPNPDEGMLSSIRHGLKRLPKTIDAIALLPGDHPFVPSGAVEELVWTYIRKRPLLLIPLYSGKRGHPLFISRELFEEASECDDAVGVRQLVWRHQHEVMELDLPFSEKHDADLDTPEDLWRIQSGEDLPEGK